MIQIDKNGSTKGPEYRYLAKLEVLDKQQELPGMDRQIELPFPTMDIKCHKHFNERTIETY